MLHCRQLEERLSLLEHDGTNDTTSLQEKCLSLQEQVTEMEVCPLVLYEYISVLQKLVVLRSLLWQVINA